MPDIETIRSWHGRTLVDRDGGKIGTIDAIYLDDETGEPEWALVNTGLFGTKSSFVPLAQAASSGDQVQVPYDKQLVKDAPRVDTDQHLSEAEEQELGRHYGLDYDSRYTTDTADRDRDGVYDDVQDSAVGRDTSGPTTDDAMTRSEEELAVTLREEEVVVDKRAVPKERVRLDTDTVTEERQVSEEVRKEQIEVDDDQDQFGRQDQR